MCGRFLLFNLPNEIIGYFPFLEELPEITARYNICPGEDILTIINGNPKLKAFRWGLVPAGSRDEKTAYKMINARAETLLERPSYKPLMKNKRCIIPANGFYEWKTEGKKKTPFCFTNPKDAIMFIAGLYDLWRGAGGKVLETCTLITTSANKTVAQFHDRMPVIFNPDESNIWLAEKDIQKALALLKPADSERMTAEEITGEKSDWLRGE